MFSVAPLVIYNGALYSWKLSHCLRDIRLLSMPWPTEKDRERSIAEYSEETFVSGRYTFRSSDRPVGPTGLSDWSVRRAYRVNASSDRRTDGRRIKHVWFRPTVCPTGRTKRLLGVYTFRSYDRPVGPTIGTCKHTVRLYEKPAGATVSAINEQWSAFCRQWDSQGESYCYGCQVAIRFGITPKLILILA